ncbi:retrovirus-related pol polyprotein from transposon TNT 1-94 [Tanacetum coccineum]|uniref:Retrovirus-related pol polyprotein from transposon TNT 1-94 n=1 Tax=Tanacetum coccineum TaxID=301880 RepID=A0ABQ4ZRW2_9ASTR
MHDKMNANACVDKKVNITPPNYSKENFLATFTPQKQLTPEQLFWSQDSVKMKAEALKVQNTRPIKALTVYPPNTPATLVPRVLPTKSQVKINIFTLRQLFSEFEKTCKKRITPTGITEGERGFEQTKTCYLTEVIPFFKTLQEHFEGIQKALTKEVKEMSDAFDELEAELDQSIVDRKHDEIARKNLLIEHDNIIVDGLSKEVFYVASNSELNVFRFTEMQKAHHVIKARCLELEAELSNLRNDVRKDNYNDLLNRFSNLEVNHLNLQLKYQNLKDSFQNKPSSSVIDTPDFNSVFVIGQMKASLQGKDNVIQKLKMEISHLKETRSELDRTLDFRARDFQISQLTEKVNGLLEQNELFRAENAKIKQHYKELYDSIKITRAKHTEQIAALKNENECLKVQPQNTVSCVTTNQVKPNKSNSSREHTLSDIVEEANVERPLDGSLAFACDYNSNLLGYLSRICVWALSKGLQSTRYMHEINCCTDASGSQPRSILRKHRIPPAKSDGLKKVVQIAHAHLVFGLRLWRYVIGVVNLQGILCEGLGIFVFCGQFCDSDLEVAFRKHRVMSCRMVVEFTLKVPCSNLFTILLKVPKKHTHKPKTENTNLEVLNTLHMDLCGPMRVQTINGKKYILVIVDDYSRFTWVKFLRSKDETPAVVLKFLAQIQVGLNKIVRFIRTDNGTEFVNKTLYDHYEKVGIFHQKTVPRTPQQNGVVERRNRTLVEAARTMLIFSKAPMFLWAEAVATACYTQNRSLIHTRHDKTPYELVHNKKPDLTFFRVFGALCYPTNDSENLGKLQPTADIGIFVGYAPNRKGYRIYNKRTRQIMETIHVTFDELTEQMAPVQFSSGPAPNLLTPGPISSGLSTKSIFLTIPYAHS